MKRRLYLSILPFFVAMTLGDHFILDKNWATSLFFGISLTITHSIGMLFFIKWWTKKVEEQRKK